MLKNIVINITSSSIHDALRTIPGSLLEKDEVQPIDVGHLDREELDRLIDYIKLVGESRIFCVLENTDGGIYKESFNMIRDSELSVVLYSSLGI